MHVPTFKYCCNIFEINLEFLISNDPHSVGMDCFTKSIDNCDNNVVFPTPVGPVNRTSSPRRNPFVMSDNMGMDGV